MSRTDTDNPMALSRYPCAAGVSLISSSLDRRRRQRPRAPLWQFLEEFAVTVREKRRERGDDRI